MLAPSHPVLCSPRLRRQRWSPALGVRSAPRGGDVPRRSCKPPRRAADSDKARSRTKQGRRARGAPARLVVALADDRSGDNASLCGGKTVAHVRPAPPHVYSTREGPSYRKKTTGCAALATYIAHDGAAACGSCARGATATGRALPHPPVARPRPAGAGALASRTRTNSHQC